MFLELLLVGSSLVLGGLTKPAGVVIAPRYEHLALGVPQASGRLQRRDADVPFDLGFEVKDLTLFSG
jgi:hypothetical protein